MTPTDRILDLSMDVLISRKNTGWSALDFQYNMYRTRKRIVGKAEELMEVGYQTPFLNIDLKAGDELIVSFQRPHNSLSQCKNQDFYWKIDENHPVLIQFPYIRNS